MMLASIVQLPTEVAENVEPSETTARQNSVEAACEGLILKTCSIIHMPFSM